MTRLLSGWSAHLPMSQTGGGENMAITHETLTFLIQFGGFIVTSLSLVVTIVIALTPKKK
ncbi:MAG TPA: hypothetical protein DEP07_22500 [Brevibacillus sp.]|nr:hypothetical protein [Brevibacillus sp.]